MSHEAEMAAQGPVADMCRDLGRDPVVPHVDCGYRVADSVAAGPRQQRPFSDAFQLLSTSPPGDDPDCGGFGRALARALRTPPAPGDWSST